MTSNITMPSFSEGDEFTILSISSCKVALTIISVGYYNDMLPILSVRSCKLVLPILLVSSCTIHTGFFPVFGDSLCFQCNNFFTDGIYVVYSKIFAERHKERSIKWRPYRKTWITQKILQIHVFRYLMTDSRSSRRQRYLMIK